MSRKHRMKEIKNKKVRFALHDDIEEKKITN